MGVWNPQKKSSDLRGRIPESCRIADPSYVGGVPPVICTEAVCVRRTQLSALRRCPVTLLIGIVAVPLALHIAIDLHMKMAPQTALDAHKLIR
jgi:hypothetical protein